MKIGSLDCSLESVLAVKTMSYAMVGTLVRVITLFFLSSTPAQVNS